MAWADLSLWYCVCRESHPPRLPRRGDSFSSVMMAALCDGPGTSISLCIMSRCAACDTTTFACASFWSFSSATVQLDFALRLILGCSKRSCWLEPTCIQLMVQCDASAYCMLGFSTGCHPFLSILCSAYNICVLSRTRHLLSSLHIRLARHVAVTNTRYKVSSRNRCKC